MRYTEREVTKGGAVLSDTTKTRIVEGLDGLPEHLQVQVLEFVQALRVLSLRGVPGERLLQFVGTIPMDDLERMREAIEEGCKWVDADEW